jgi:hypothetical protein
LTKKKRILVFIDWYYPGYRAGGPIRSCLNMISALSRHVDFYVITRNTDYCSEEVYESVKSNEWNQLDESVWVNYISIERLNYRNLKEAASSVQPDLVYVNGIYSFIFPFFRY